MSKPFELPIDSEIEGLFSSAPDGVFYRPDVLSQDTASLIWAILVEYGELPVNITRVLEVLRDESSDAQDLASVIELDPGLAGKVLKLVNSAYYGLQGKVSSLKHAVAILGFNTLRTLITGVAAFNEMRRLRLPQDMPLSELWKHSVAVSQVAARIGRKAGKVDHSCLVSAGLLHDAGKLLLAAVEPTRFLKAVRTADQMSGDLLGYELDIIGISHPIMGAALAIKWNLPEKLWSTILHQQHPAAAPHKREAAALMLAEFFGRGYNIGADGQGRHRFPPQEALDVLEIDYDEAENYVLDDQMKIVIEQTEAIGGLE
jgi:putative nucleotidyltransferase with HDIG domain